MKKWVREVGLYLVGAFGLYLVTWQFGALVPYTLGYIWNWSAAQNLEALFQKRRYRFSTIKMVKNLQDLFLRPFSSTPPFFKLIVRSLPAGIFWGMVILANESESAIWPTFLGSLLFELTTLDLKFPRKETSS